MSSPDGFWLRLFWEPMKNNMALMMGLLGAFLLTLGGVFGDAIDHFALVPTGTGKTLSGVGSAILGAGVFAAVMKSEQFTNLFQKHIYDVFYNPLHVKDKDALLEKWRTISNALLKNVLPHTYSDAISKLEQLFLNSELEYHFENYSVSYMFTIDTECNSALIRSTCRASIIVSPHIKNPILRQSIVTDGEYKLVALRLNDSDVSGSHYYCKKENEKENEYELAVPLNKFVTTRRDGIQSISFERVTEWSQNLNDDPYVKAELSRYVRGLAIRAQISGPYKLFFANLGLEKKESNLKDDGEGYERWILGNSEELLLPGQGYILMIAPYIAKG